MANILLNICLSDLPKEFIKAVTSQKTGVTKKYINLVVAEKKQADERGNDHFVKVYIPREQRKDGDKAIYVGNGKSMGYSREREDAVQQPKSSVKDDLPF